MLASPAAHTGAQQSKLGQCKVPDRDLTITAVTIHERKRSKSTRATRMIPLRENLNQVLTEWLRVKSEISVVFPESQFDVEDELPQPDENFMTPWPAPQNLVHVV